MHPPEQNAVSGGPTKRHARNEQPDQKCNEIDRNESIDNKEIMSIT